MPLLRTMTYSEEQLNLMERLNSLKKRMEEYDEGDIIGPRRRTPKGLYISGSVGTGKTMLLNLFYSTLNIPRKRRVHLHALIQEIHKRMHLKRIISKNKTFGSMALNEIGLEISKETALLALDEFVIPDEAEALILGQVLDSAMHHGTVLVTSSNFSPDSLWKEESWFVKEFINKTLLKYCRPFHFQSNLDYRKIFSSPTGALIVIKTGNFEPFLKNNNYNNSNNNNNKEEEIIKNNTTTTSSFFLPLDNVNNRKITFDEFWVDEEGKKNGSIAFHSLFGKGKLNATFGLPDYIKLCESSLIDKLVLVDLPQFDLSIENSNNNKNNFLEMRKFCNFIDLIYDYNNLELICLSKHEKIFINVNGIDDLLGNKENLKVTSSYDFVTLGAVKRAESRFYQMMKIINV